MSAETLTFLFSDVEGSTGLLAKLGAGPFGELLERQAATLEAAASRHGGRQVDRQGDGCFFVFSSASEAVRAATQAQDDLAAAEWPQGVAVKVRIGVHTGEATVTGGRFLGAAVHRAARICAAATGGQVLISTTTRDVAADALPPELPLVEAGELEVKGLDGRERLYAVKGSAALAVRPRPAPPGLRLADADRERVATLLREHCVQGRLTLEEFSARLDELYAAATDRELVAVLRELPEPAGAPVPASKRFSLLFLLIGSVQRRGPWRVPRRIFAFSLLGAPDLDFRQAVLGSEEVRITSISLVGVVTAIVPAGIEVELGGLALVGGNDFVTRDQIAQAPGGPRIRIRSFALFGGARIKHVRPELPPAAS